MLTLYLDHEGINKTFHRLLFALFYVALTATISRTKLKALSHVLTLLLAATLCVSLTNHYRYASPFNEGFAWSLLSTHHEEFVMMASMFWFVPILLLALFAGLRELSHLVAKHMNYRSTIQRGLFITLGTIVAATGVEASIKTQKANTIYHSSSAALRKTLFHNFAYVLDSTERQKFLVEAASQVYSHTLSKSFNGPIPTIVVVIGESASRDHHSIYGYSQTTTPSIESLQTASIIFDQAIAPAPYTLLSVPLSLSTAQNNPASHRRMMDSIVKLANTVGYTTYWISVQGQSGPDDSTIAAIAQSAQHQHWLSGPDERVLGPLNDIISTTYNEERMIFIHINGSHEPPCSKVAPDALKFSKGDREDACYDTTIWNTDQLILKISAMIKGTPAALLYFSDHGLVKRRGQYIHAAGVPPQEAINVPMYLWLSSSIRHSLKGTRVTNRYATLNNYYLIADLMGVYVDQQSCMSVLSSCYDFSSPIAISDTSGNTHSYDHLATSSTPTTK